METSTIIIGFFLISGLIGLGYTIFKSQSDNVMDDTLNENNESTQIQATLVKEKVIQPTSKPNTKGRKVQSNKVEEPKVEKTVVVESKNPKRRKSNK